MKIIGIIPARYMSSRFQGKPLADINGKPMIWWVYKQVEKVKQLSEIYVATDDERIKATCDEFGMNVIMTSSNHKTPTDRIHEVSDKIEADLYLSINGDEPLIDPKVIEKVIPTKAVSKDELFVQNIITVIKDPVEVVDSTNLKVVANEKGEGIYISRNPVPYPKGSMDCKYKKHVGVYAFNKLALDFYVNTKRGNIEKIEDIDLLRYIENGQKVQFVEANCNTLSVDNPKDLDRVKQIISKKAKK